jgi:hypothetical protein
LINETYFDILPMIGLNPCASVLHIRRSMAEQSDVMDGTFGLSTGQILASILMLSVQELKMESPGK